LKIPPLPKREPKAAGGASGARFFLAEQLHPEATAGRVEMVACPLATQLQIAQWQAEKGAKLTFTLPIQKAGRTSLHLVAVHRPDGGSVRVFLDGKPLPATSGAEEVPLQSTFAPRVLNVHFDPVDLAAGPHEIVLECVASGPVGLDYVWLKRQ
jgi:hypothetical protein